jgi:hypothetical protein
MSFPSAEILAMGLEYAGYDAHRQARRIKKLETRVYYFVSCFGHAPDSFVPLFDDLCNSQAACDVLGKAPVLSEFLMMTNWFKEATTFNSLGGKFKMNPHTASKWCWAYAEAVAALYNERVCVFVVLFRISQHYDDKNTQPPVYLVFFARLSLDRGIIIQF